MSATKLPPPKPQIFTGEPLKFVEWRISFNALVEGKGLTASERMYYLHEYVTGEARKAVEGLFYRTSEEAYQEAWAILEERFGNAFILKQAFHEKIGKWPNINSRDVYGLRDFVDFLTATASAIPHISGLEILNDCEENQKILERMPEWIIRGWNRVVIGHMERTPSYPDFQTFVDFLRREVKIACNPICSPFLFKPDRFTTKEPKRQTLASRVEVESTSLAMKEGTPSARRFQPGGNVTQGRKVSPKGQSHPTRELKFHQQTETDGRLNSPCTFCNRPGHALDSCLKFKEESVAKKKEYVQAN